MFQMHMPGQSGMLGRSHSSVQGSACAPTPRGESELSVYSRLYCINLLAGVAGSTMLNELFPGLTSFTLDKNAVLPRHLI